MPHMTVSLTRREAFGRSPLILISSSPTRRLLVTSIATLFIILFLSLLVENRCGAFRDNIILRNGNRHDGVRDLSSLPQHRVTVFAAAAAVIETPSQEEEEEDEDFEEKEDLSNSATTTTTSTGSAALNENDQNLDENEHVGMMASTAQHDPTDAPAATTTVPVELAEDKTQEGEPAPTSFSKEKEKEDGNSNSNAIVDENADKKNNSVPMPKPHPITIALQKRFSAENNQGGASDGAASSSSTTAAESSLINFSIPSLMYELLMNETYASTKTIGKDDGEEGGKEEKEFGNAVNKPTTIATTPQESSPSSSSNSDGNSGSSSSSPSSQGRRRRPAIRFNQALISKALRERGIIVEKQEKGEEEGKKTISRKNGDDAPPKQQSSSSTPSSHATSTPKTVTKTLQEYEREHGHDDGQQFGSGDVVSHKSEDGLDEKARKQEEEEEEEASTTMATPATDTAAEATAIPTAEQQQEAEADEIESVVPNLRRDAVSGEAIDSGHNAEKEVETDKKDGDTDDDKKNDPLAYFYPNIPKAMRIEMARRQQAAMDEKIKKYHQLVKKREQLQMGDGEDNTLREEEEEFLAKFESGGSAANTNNNQNSASSSTEIDDQPQKVSQRTEKEGKTKVKLTPEEEEALIMKRLQEKLKEGSASKDETSSSLSRKERKEKRRKELLEHEEAKAAQLKKEAEEKAEELKRRKEAKEAQLKQKAAEKQRHADAGKLIVEAAKEAISQRQQLKKDDDDDDDENTAGSSSEAERKKTFVTKNAAANDVANDRDFEAIEEEFGDADETDKGEEGNSDNSTTLEDDNNTITKTTTIELIPHPPQSSEDKAIEARRRRAQVYRYQQWVEGRKGESGEKKITHPPAAGVAVDVTVEKLSAAAPPSSTTSSENVVAMVGDTVLLHVEIYESLPTIGGSNNNSGKVIYRHIVSGLRSFQVGSHCLDDDHHDDETKEYKNGDDGAVYIPTRRNTRACYQQPQHRHNTLPIIHRGILRAAEGERRRITVVAASNCDDDDDNNTSGGRKTESVTSSESTKKNGGEKSRKMNQDNSKEGGEVFKLKLSGLGAEDGAFIFGQRGNKRLGIPPFYTPSSPSSAFVINVTVLKIIPQGKGEGGKGDDIQEEDGSIFTTLIEEGKEMILLSSQQQQQHQFGDEEQHVGECIELTRELDTLIDAMGIDAVVNNKKTKMMTKKQASSHFSQYSWGGEWKPQQLVDFVLDNSSFPTSSLTAVSSQSLFITLFPSSGSDTEAVINRNPKVAEFSALQQQHIRTLEKTNAILQTLTRWMTDAAHHRGDNDALLTSSPYELLLEIYRNESLSLSISSENTNSQSGQLDENEKKKDEENDLARKKRIANENLHKMLKESTRKMVIERLGLHKKMKNDKIACSKDATTLDDDVDNDDDHDDDDALINQLVEAQMSRFMKGITLPNNNGDDGGGKKQQAARYNKKPTQQPSLYTVFPSLKKLRETKAKIGDTDQKKRDQGRKKAGKGKSSSQPSPTELLFRGDDLFIDASAELKKREEEERQLKMEEANPFKQFEASSSVSTKANNNDAIESPQSQSAFSPPPLFAAISDASIEFGGGQMNPSALLHDPTSMVKRFYGASSFNKQQNNDLGNGDNAQEASHGNAKDLEITPTASPQPPKRTRRQMRAQLREKWKKSTVENSTNNGEEVDHSSSSFLLIAIDEEMLPHKSASKDSIIGDDCGGLIKQRQSIEDSCASSSSTPIEKNKKRSRNRLLFTFQIDQHRIPSSPSSSLASSSSSWPPYSIIDYLKLAHDIKVLEKALATNHPQQHANSRDDISATSIIEPYRSHPAVLYFSLVYEATLSSVVKY